MIKFLKEAAAAVTVAVPFNFQQSPVFETTLQKQAVFLVYGFLYIQYAVSLVKFYNFSLLTERSVNEI